MKTRMYGKCIGNETRCIHWNSDLDIIAIKFACCNEYYPCYPCHIEREKDHKPKQWIKDKWNTTKTILCGKCKHQFTINEFNNCNNVYFNCNSKFNPGCRNHYHLHFNLKPNSKLCQVMNLLYWCYSLMTIASNLVHFGMLSSMCLLHRFHEKCHFQSLTFQIYYEQY